MPDWLVMLLLQIPASAIGLLIVVELHNIYEAWKERRR
jgi:hypothetical protein